MSASSPARTRVRAAVLDQAPGRLVLTEVDVDDWLAPDEVRVRVLACGLCHSDLHMLEGEFPVVLPTVPGHEISGTVEAVGSSVDDLAVGDRVSACLSMFCGRCVACRTGRTWICERRHDLGRVDRPQPRLVRDGAPVGQVAGLGGLSEVTVLHRNSVVRVPTEVPADRAALLGCAVLTGVGSVVNGARVRAGETVAVIGCGGVGLNVLQGARIAGASRIVAVDLSAEKLELARRFGATDVVDSSAEDAVTAVQELTGGVDHVFDVVGRSRTISSAVAMLRPGRTAWMVGIPPMGEEIVLPGLSMVTQAKGVQGLLMGANYFPRDLPLLADLYLQDRLELDALVSQRVPLEQVNEGFDLMRRGEAARVVVTFGDS
ncbi:S-(hydroxymethyl)mycothiol dehydrogenase [Nocardioides dokdonensis FR1436]|uniref:S-(Hydroxymethyl)mycothiol dehydrogenase n=1 Tax=Nocardioides dokdonensis FR1436 TaxID=1300347 RepID=A0A1A9GFP7_9ACTN|nr:Zn-dependent alcohol dehydrogenase [Nocardioides dokdonensis]ANH37098.1 S-(hydroxymethyl)mycothiol dehydrogenase [Nocardioides dokdonensis FR1436]